MAWPKKGTRKLVIDGTTWLWRHRPYDQSTGLAPATIGRAECCYYLYLDASSRYFENTPRHAAMAIRWALENGWCAEVGPSRVISGTSWALEDGSYVELGPSGVLSATEVTFRWLLEEGTQRDSQPDCISC